MTGSRILAKKDRHKCTDSSIYILVFDGSGFKIHVHYFGYIHLVVFDVLSFDRVVVDFYEVVDVSLVV